MPFRCRTTDTFSSVWHAWHFLDVKHWQVWVKMRDAFGGHFTWQAQYLANLEDALKRSTSFCETVVIFDFGHDDDSVWQVQYFVDSL